MNYIDKSTHLKAGNLITEDYIRACKVEDSLNGEISYAVDYDGTFRTLPAKPMDSYYKRMRSLLVENQGGYCCYCMRRITGLDYINPINGKTENDTTLEHIIPQSANDGDQDYYDTHQLRTKGVGKHVVLSQSFTHQVNPPYPPYPHTVAYRNLVASCQGRFPSKGLSGCCCNNVRSSNQAFPVYYLENAGHIIEYTHEGGIFANSELDTDGTAAQMINAAKLKHPSLIDIRQMWYILRNVTMDIINICMNNADKRREILSVALSVSGLSIARRKELQQKFMIQNQWDTFVQYDYFHFVFQSAGFVNR